MSRHAAPQQPLPGRARASCGESHGAGWDLLDPEHSPETVDLLVLSLSAHTMLYFNDQRKFGWIRLVDSDALAGEEFLSGLAPSR